MTNEEQNFLLDYNNGSRWKSKNESEEKEMKTVTETLKENKKALDSMPAAYEIKASEVYEILQTTGAPIENETLHAIEAAYRYGIIKGQRYVLNKLKREQ